MPGFFHLVCGHIIRKAFKQEEFKTRSEKEKRRQIVKPILPWLQWVEVFQSRFRGIIPLF